MSMNAKKISEIKPKENLFGKILKFFGSVKTEFKKITWTNKKDLLAYTKVILASTFIVSFLIYFVDLCIQKSLQVVHLVTQWVFG